MADFSVSADFQRIFIRFQTITAERFVEMDANSVYKLI